MVFLPQQITEAAVKTALIRPRHVERAPSFPDITCRFLPLAFRQKGVAIPYRTGHRAGRFFREPC